MRAVLALAIAFALVPVASAEFGPYDDNGYPIAVDGTSTFPGGVYPGGALPEGPANVLGPLTVYPYYPVLTAEVQRLALDHPDLVRVHSMGKSTLGLDLWMLEIADFAAIDAGEGVPLDEREVVWVDGGTHSNEYSGVYFTAHLASYLLDQYETNETAKWIVDNRHTWIAPLVNPDGSNAFGRLNARLVNINRNYPVVWDGEGNDLLLNNRGPEPASEAETQANIEWFNKTRPDYYASVHCCGNLWLYPYGEEGVDPLDNDTLARVCTEAFPGVKDKCGPIWSTIYPASGSSVDTVYEYTGAVAFGYEMSGRGAVLLWGQPFTSESVEEQETESWTGVLHALMNVEKYGAHLTIVGAEVVDGSLRLTLVNDGYGPLTAGNITYAPIDDGRDGLIEDYVARTVEIPPLAPNATAVVELDGPFGAGTIPITLQYLKRIQAAPARHDTIAMTLERLDDELKVAAIDGVPLVAAAIDDPPSTVPAAPLGLVALVTLAVALRRRR